MFITAFHSFAMITEILTILNNFVKILDEFSINSCGRVYPFFTDFVVSHIVGRYPSDLYRGGSRPPPGFLR